MQFFCPECKLGTSTDQGESSGRQSDEEWSGSGHLRGVRECAEGLLSVGRA